MYIVIEQGRYSVKMSMAEIGLYEYSHARYVSYLSDVYGIYCNQDKVLLAIYP